MPISPSPQPPHLIFTHHSRHQHLKPTPAIRSFFVWRLFKEKKMSSMKLCVLPIIGFMFLAILQLGYGHATAPSPAPEGPSSDGMAIDQGIAYFLLLVALAVTYMFH